MGEKAQEGKNYSFRTPARAWLERMGMRDAGNALGREWHRRGIELGLGIGIAQGYTTIGAIGYESRFDYGANGTVTNVAARLCAEAASGQILNNHKTLAAVGDLVIVEEVGEIYLKGFSRPIATARIVALKA